MGEIGDCKFFLILILRELSSIRFRIKAKVKIDCGKEETPKRITQPPLPHPLRHVVLLGLSLLSFYAAIGEAPVSPVVTLLFQSHAYTLGNARAIADGLHGRP
jgi:hypothetical protein